MENVEEFIIKDNDFLRQFETRINGEFVNLEYSLQPRKIFLTKFIMSAALREKGYEKKFLKAVFDRLSEQHIRVVPTSPEVAKFFKANKREYRSLLPIGISI